MTINEFLTYFNGIYCDFDGAYGDQCFDLANGYSRWIGGPRFTGETADLIINQAGTFYVQVDNTADNFPVKGDIVVWKWPHVGIATGDNTDAKGFDALEQNDPEGSDCHLKHYSYSGVLGWLHPIQVSNTDNQTLLDQVRAERDTNWNLYQAERNAKIDLEDQLDAKNKANESLVKENLADKTTITTITNEKINLSTSLQSLTKALDDTKTELSVCNGLLSNRKDIGKFTKTELFTELINRLFQR